jgi:hypothetical protein
MGSRLQLGLGRERPWTRVVPVASAAGLLVAQRWSRGRVGPLLLPGDPDGHLVQVSLAGTATDVQAYYAIAGGLVQGDQLFAM